MSQVHCARLQGTLNFYISAYCGIFVLFFFSSVTSKVSNFPSLAISFPVIKRTLANFALWVALIISFDERNYMNYLVNEQVTGFLEGERDYSNLKGDTGPLVYPAGFLYVYSAIQYVTGGDVYPAQVISDNFVSL